MISDRAAELFQATFSASPVISAFAPGRVNLIGEHTDYNDGFVFPMAIERGIGIAARPTSSGTKLYSKQKGKARPFDVRRAPAMTGWERLPAEVAAVLRERGCKGLPNIEAAVTADLPPAGGLSSSAAVAVGFAKLWTMLFGINLSELELARVAQEAEQRALGVECGLMDQFASASGQPGRAMFVDMRSMETHFATLPNGLSIVLCDTGVSRELQGSAYNERRDECRRAAHHMGIESLRDATLDHLLEHQEDMDPILFRRARHVITENTRCQSFFWALEDGNELRIGLLMRASHESLREDFQVTGPELDTMAEACWTAPGCVGARMTGAGFGGFCVAMVRNEQVAEFKRSAGNRYEAKMGKNAKFLIVTAGPGASCTWI